MTVDMILERMAEIDFEIEQLRIEYESLQDDLHEINESKKEAEDREWRQMKI